MTVKIVLLVLFCASLKYSKSAGMDLPSYMRKCSRSDANLGECFKKNGNAAIEFLAKGDKSLGIPSITPITIEKAPIPAVGMNYIAYDVQCYDMKDFRITEARLDLKAGKISMTWELNRCEVVSKNYTVFTGKAVDIEGRGHGKWNMTILDLIVHYSSDLRVYKKGGEEYLELVNSKLKADSGRCYYYFENLKAPNGTDLNPYLDENWKRFRSQMRPVDESYLTTFLHMPLSKIFKNVPISKLFLP